MNVLSCFICFGVWATSGMLLTLSSGITPGDIGALGIELRSSRCKAMPYLLYYHSAPIQYFFYLVFVLCHLISLWLESYVVGERKHKQFVFLAKYNWVYLCQETVYYGRYLIQFQMSFRGRNKLMYIFIRCCIYLIDCQSDEKLGNHPKERSISLSPTAHTLGRFALSVGCL